MNIDALEALLARESDNALLRFGLGKAYLDDHQPLRAREHFQRCVEFDPAYSAAWKLLGKACLAAEDRDAARSAWQQGIESARLKGDKQAEKEMAVFLRRLDQ